MKTLRSRLTWLYTVTTGAILLLVIAAFFLFSLRDARKTRLEQFQVIWNSLSSRFISSNALSQGFLAQMEADYHMVIHIRENGVPFLYKGSWKPDTDRRILIERARTLGENQGVFMDRAPVSSTVNTTLLMTVEGDQGDQYYAMVTSLATKNGVKSLCAVSLIPPVGESLKETLLLLSLLAVSGIVCLWLVSWKFVGWSLKPVEESQKKQAQFIAAASHELRSPLAVLRAAASSLSHAQEPQSSSDPPSPAPKPQSSPDPSPHMQEPQSPPAPSPRTPNPRRPPGPNSPQPADFPCEEQEKDVLLSLIDSECARMSRLVDDMLFLASADAKTWSLRLETVDMDTLLIDLYEAFQPLCREKGIPLRLELPSQPLPRITADPERIRQLLLILLDNAKTYTPPGRSVSLRARVSGNLLTLEVADQGCGIPDHIKHYVFDRFYRADGSRSDKQHFGLGLSIARELTLLHGGKIQAADEPGGGACFSVSLPITLPPASPCRPGSPSS